MPPLGSAAASNQRSTAQFELNVRRHLYHSHDVTGCDQLRADRSRAAHSPRQIKRAGRIERTPEIETEDVVS
jgi:hypothetical protein